MKKALLIAAASALVSSMGGAWAQMDHSKTSATHCRHMDHSMRHPKGCVSHVRCSGCPGMEKRSDMQSMGRSGARGTGGVMDPGHEMGNATMMGGVPDPLPSASPKP